MLDELLSVIGIESARPHSEIRGSTAEVIRIRPTTVEASVAEVGHAIGVMLGGVAEQVSTITQTSYAILSDAVILDGKAQKARDDEATMRGMIAGNELEVGIPDQHDTSVLDAMVQETTIEDAAANVVSLDAYKDAQLIQDQMAAKARAFLKNAA